MIKLDNEMLTELRRELHREAETVQAKAVLKGTRWLLLKRATDLDEERGEPDRLREALKLNQSLAVAYYLKDDLNRFWQQPNKALAAQWLKDWLHDAETSGIRLVQKFAKTVVKAFSPGTITRSPPVRWKPSTTRSASSTDKPTATATPIFSGSNSTRSIRRGTR